MNFNYQFNDIFGSVYKNGNICFLSDGSRLLSPIGNMLKIFDLKKNSSQTIQTQFHSNIQHISVNTKGTHAFLSDEYGCCFYINLSQDIILHKFFPDKQQGKIRSLKLSPDNRCVAIGLRGIVKIYSVASFDTVQFNPVHLILTFKHSVDNVTSIDWSFDGRLVVAGGENGSSKVFPVQKGHFINAQISTLSERGMLISTYFYPNDYDILAIDKTGHATIWSSSLKPNELVSARKGVEYSEEELGNFGRLSFSRKTRSKLSEHSGGGPSIALTATALKKPNLLFVAFSNGVFCLFELDDFILLQNFRVTESSIKTLSASPNGDWIAMGCGQGTEGQLIVWEWQSETYIMKQQSHSQTITSAAYSPDGFLLATGSEDGKVKIWNNHTSFCTVTFTDHTTAVSDICFTQSGKVILSASLDGTIRAHDMKRYRNFCTMAAPKQTQLSSLCADSSGDLVMASSRADYEVFVWSLETGDLLEVLTGHSSLITRITCFGSVLTTVSLDKTLRLWNIFEASCTETVQLINEGLDVKYRFFDTRNMQQLGTIETRLDIDGARAKKEKIKKSTSEKNKSFTCIAFSPEGQFIVAGGQSNKFCIYSVQDRMPLRSFKLTNNLSLDGVSFDYNYRKLTEFGHLDLFELSDSDDERTDKRRIPLPGTRHSDMSERSSRPIVTINYISFSPTGQNFAVVSTEGVSIYSNKVNRRFDPYQLDMEIGAESILKTLHEQNYAKSLCMALRLNDSKLTSIVVESVPSTQIRIVSQSLGFEYAHRLLRWIASTKSTSKHIHFYQLFIKELLYCYAAELKSSLHEVGPTITAVQQMLSQNQSLLLNLADQNTHSLEYLIATKKITNLKIEC